MSIPTEFPLKTMFYLNFQHDFFYFYTINQLSYLKQPVINFYYYFIYIYIYNISFLFNIFSLYFHEYGSIFNTYLTKTACKLSFLIIFIYCNNIKNYV